MKNSISMTQFAATIADAMQAEAPKSSAAPITLVQDLIARGGKKPDRVLIYNPDAIGMWLFQKYTARFAPVLCRTSLCVPVCTVLPSVTPVCFGTMYTGAMPAEHGIQKYEKKLISTDSLFDSMIRAGKKVAIVAVKGSSMEAIFAGKALDYYILPYDQEVNQKALELIAQDSYDLIAVYNQEYDDVMHRTCPESETALAAMEHHIEAFAALTDAVQKEWAHHNTLVCWATDHGIHTNSEGFGTHGDDIDDDLNVLHFFGMQAAK